MVFYRISHYRILKKLGAGGMGEVYRAWDTKRNHRVALTIRWVYVADNDDRGWRFMLAARAAANRTSPNCRRSNL